MGSLLAVLAAAVRRGGRILELGTGVGVGLAWLVDGLGERTDVSVVSVDLDPELQGLARQGDWPPYVRFELGDGAELVRSLGRFDLIFADAPGGKLHGLADTLAALEVGGLLLVDDMDLDRHADADLRASLLEVRQQLLVAPDLRVVELGAASGIMLAVRSR